MNTFTKTFIVCLIISLGFLFYKYTQKDAFQKELDVVNPSVYSIQKEDKYVPVKEQETQVKEDKTTPKEETKNYHTCFFYTKDGKLTPVTRETKSNNDIESAVLILLKGPLVSETKQGIYTEIPANVDLINVTTKKNSVIINLTSNFANGGGSDSVENRIKQLSQTVKQVAKNKSIYLYIDGKQVEYLGGDGVYVKQPIN